VKKRLPLLLLLCSLLAATATAEDDGSLQLVESRRIWDKAPHNAFTDLIRFKDRWYCVFREAEGHGSQDGVLRVITSPEGADWESAALIGLTLQDLNDLKPEVPPEGPGMDLRDPKVCITPDGRLMLSTGMYYNDRRDLQSLAWYSDDGKNWGRPAMIGENRYWLWRVTWHRLCDYYVDRVGEDCEPFEYYPGPTVTAVEVEEVTTVAYRTKE